MSSEETGLTSRSFLFAAVGAKFLRRFAIPIELILNESFLRRMTHVFTGEKESPQ